MKTKLKQLVVIAAGSLLLAGCCTTHHVTGWEYRIVREARNHTGGPDQWIKDQEALMNGMGRNGWILVSQSDGRLFYFKRRLK